MDLPSTRSAQYWIVAVLFVLTPIVFNPFGHSSYELAKVALVGVAVAVGLLLGLARRGNGVGEMWRGRLSRPVLAVAVSWVVATLFSVNPAVSLLGLSIRAQGLYVAICYAVVFWWAAETVRSARRARWLLTAAALGSVPVCALGMYERLVTNPIAGRITFSGRAASTLGNPILLGDYLVMVLPAAVCLGWLCRSWRRAAWWALAAGQGVCLVFTGTRAAWAAALAVGCVSLCVVGWRTGRRWLTGFGLGLPLAFVVLVAAVNAPWRLGHRLRALPFVQRLSILSELEVGGGVERVRPTVWRACLRLLRGRTSVPVGSAALRWARPLIGYGPETLGATFCTVFPPALVRDEGRRTHVDRAHSLVIDVVIERGLLGVAALVWLWVSFVRGGAGGLMTCKDSGASAAIGACMAGAGAHLLTSQIGVELTASSVLLYGYFGMVAGLTRGAEAASEPGSLHGPRLATGLVRGLAVAFALLVGAATSLLVLADTHFGTAFKSYRRGGLESGAVAASCAAQLMPLQSDYHLLLSQLYLRAATTRPLPPRERQLLFEQSLRWVQTAISLRPLMAHYYEAAARVCSAAAAGGGAGFEAKVPAYWRKALAISPGRPQFWEGLAEYHAGRREYGRAIKCLNRSLEIEPGRAETWCMVARVALAKGDVGQARASVDAALRGDPRYEPALVLRRQLPLAQPHE